MRKFFNFTLLIVIFISFINANNLNNRAFNLYKMGEYRDSLKLYLKSAKRDDIKALLMIALFYEKGLGVKEDKNRAIKIYKNILKRTSNIKKIVKSKNFKRLNITIMALERLYELTNNIKYKRLAKKLITLKSNANTLSSNLFNGSSVEDDYLILCPGAKIIPPEDREGIEDFDCALFENFPKEMAKFMHLRRLRFKALELSDDIRDRYLVKIDAKIETIIEPMIKYLQKEVENCYANAIDMNDIRSCNYDYLLKTDPLQFRNRAYRLEQYVLRHNLENHELNPYEKEEIIDKLVNDIKNSRYGKNWKDMVK